MSRLKSRTMPNLFELIDQKPNRRLEDGQSEEINPVEVPVLAVEIPLLAVREILIPKFWPNMERIIQVPAKVNWLKQINEFEYEAGITLQGSYPYNSDCSSIWRLKKIGEKFIPICDLLNNRR